MHAEATSEKIAMGRFLDGKVSIVVGTHTHVATADEQILPKGTAYISDVGMCGPHDSVLGRDVDAVLRRFLTQLPQKMEVAEGDVVLCGVIVDVHHLFEETEVITTLASDCTIGREIFWEAGPTVTDSWIEKARAYASI